MIGPTNSSADCGSVSMPSACSPRLGASLAGPPHSVETDAGCSRVGCQGGEEHA